MGLLMYQYMFLFFQHLCLISDLCHSLRRCAISCWRNAARSHPSFFPGDAANDATNANKANNANNADGEVAGGVRCAIAPSAGDTGAEGADELRPGSRWRRKEEGRRKKGGESGVSASEFHPSVLRLGIATIAGMDPDSVCAETSRDAREGRVGEVAGGDAEVAVSGRASGAGVAECDADVGAGGGRHGLFAPPVVAAEAHSDSEEAK